MTDGPSGDESAAPSFVRYGTVLAGAEPFKFNKNINPVYRGQVTCSDGDTVTAFIKDLDPRQFGNELLAAAIGLKVGLPIPPPIIARASPDDMPAERIPLGATGDFIVFASADANTPPILQVLNQAGPLVGEVMKRLSGWGKLGELYGFDAWIANTDRHRGNLLFSGKDDVWLIDHGHSFTGPAWTRDALAPAHPYLNKLANWLTPCLTGARRAELAGPAGALPGCLAGCSLEALARANALQPMLGDDFDAIMTFLKSRAEYVPHLSTAALDLLI